MSLPELHYSIASPAFLEALARLVCKEGCKAMERRSRKIQWENEDGPRRGSSWLGQSQAGRVSQKPSWDLTTGGQLEGGSGVHKLTGELTESWADSGHPGRVTSVKWAAETPPLHGHG